KDTDCNTLLYFKSHHPYNLKHNLPLGPFLCRKMNSSTLDTYQQAAGELEIALGNRGYPWHMIHKAQVKADACVRWDLLVPRSKIPQKCITCSFEFTPQTMEGRQIINRYWGIVSHIAGCDLPPLIGFRRTRNLKYFPVHATETASYHVPNRSTILKSNGFTNCATRNVIYLTQRTCQLIYIGATTRPVKIRILEHGYRIRGKIREAPLVEHLIEQNHTCDDFRFFCCKEPIFNSLHGC
ncbi:uncharacterized protein LOC144329091, partial [Podarcis muralis]